MMARPPVRMIPKITAHSLVEDGPVWRSSQDKGTLTSDIEALSPPQRLGRPHCHLRVYQTTAVGIHHRKGPRQSPARRVNDGGVIKRFMQELQREI